MVLAAAEHPALGGPAAPAVCSVAAGAPGAAGLLAAVRGDDFRGLSVALAVESAEELAQPASTSAAVRKPRTAADRRVGVRGMNTSLTYAWGLGFLMPMARHL